MSEILLIQYDEVAELEWLSNLVVVEDSFSSEDQQKLQLIQGLKARPTHHDNHNTNTNYHHHHHSSSSSSSQTLLYQFHPEPDPVRNPPPPIFPSQMPSVPAKARSKRSRAPPANWATRLLAVSPNNSSTTPSSTPISSQSEIVLKKTTAASAQKTNKEIPPESSGGTGEGRKCLHCATDKTPQWRTGPMGPKTLCNACGVRYKSGRLVPEYRPAASPTFVLTKHSNSHRKVMELRRQKEMMRVQQQNHHHHHHHHHHHQFLQHHHHHQSMMFNVSSAAAANVAADDYLIHQHIGPDFRQLI